MPLTRSSLHQKTSAPADPDKPSILLNLPLELKIMIFEYLLVRDVPIRNMRPRINYRADGNPLERLPLHQVMLITNSDAILQTSILASSKQMHAEAAPALYNRNTFLVEDAGLVDVYHPGSKGVVHTSIVHHIYGPLIRQVRVVPLYNDGIWVAIQPTWICDMLKRWPKVNKLRLVLEQDRITIMNRVLQLGADREGLIRHIAETINECCSLADLKLRKDLQLIVEGARFVTGFSIIGLGEVQGLDAVKSIASEAPKAAKSMKRARP